MSDNNFERKGLLFTGLIALGIGLVSGYFVGLVMGIILAAVAGLVAYYLFNKLSPKPETPADDQETGPNLDAVLDTLAELNLTVRLESIRGRALSSIETTIDDLISLLPKAEQALENGELKWVVYRIATDYLPNKAVRPYIGLNKSQRESENTITNLVNGQLAMQEEIKEIENLISQKNHAEFQAKAKFLQHKFNI